jgi:hypothetical protein
MIRAVQASGLRVVSVRIGSGAVEIRCGEGGGSLGSDDQPERNEWDEVLQ